MYNCTEEIVQMKNPVLLIVSFIFCFNTYAQTDTVCVNHKTIPCKITEIATDAVRYQLNGESILHSVYKNAVQYVRLANGRYFKFTESSNYKNINSPEDYPLVSFTQLEYEVKGLYKIDKVSAKAAGTTSLSNQERIKERAFKKLRIQAAMQGANIIYLMSIRTQGNSLGTYYFNGLRSEASIFGMCYSTFLPDFTEFEKAIGAKREFRAFSMTTLWGSDPEPETEACTLTFNILNIRNENGLIYLEGNLEGEKKEHLFRVVSFNTNEFRIFYQGKSTCYQLTIKI